MDIDKIDSSERLTSSSPERVAQETPPPQRTMRDSHGEGHVDHFIPGGPHPLTEGDMRVML